MKTIGQVTSNGTSIAMPREHLSEHAAVFSIDLLKESDAACEFVERHLISGASAGEERPCFHESILKSEKRSET